MEQIDLPFIKKKDKKEEKEPEETEDPNYIKFLEEQADLKAKESGSFKENHEPTEEQIKLAIEAQENQPVKLIKKQTVEEVKTAEKEAKKARRRFWEPELPLKE